MSTPPRCFRAPKSIQTPARLNALLSLKAPKPRLLIGQPARRTRGLRCFSAPAAFQLLHLGHHTFKPPIQPIAVDQFLTTPLLYGYSTASCSCTSTGKKPVVVK
ncbi:hypothetical protein V8C26DRAFT_384940 [Trichoderma gracile]